MVLEERPLPQNTSNQWSHLFTSHMKEMEGKMTNMLVITCSRRPPLNICNHLVNPVVSHEVFNVCTMLYFVWSPNVDYLITWSYEFQILVLRLSRGWTWTEWMVVPCTGHQLTAIWTWNTDSVIWMLASFPLLVDWRLSKHTLWRACVVHASNLRYARLIALDTVTPDPKILESRFNLQFGFELCLHRIWHGNFWIL